MDTVHSWLKNYLLQQTTVFSLVLYVYCSFQAENAFLWAKLMKLRLEHEVDHVRLA